MSCCRTRSSRPITANAFHSYSRVDHPDFKPYFYDLSVDSLRPTVRIEPSWADYLAGRDVVYEAALRATRRGHTNP